MFATRPPRTDLGSVPYRDFFYPLLRPATPPAGGTWNPSSETFVVHEIPLYPFVGEGEHAALRVEKRGLTTRDLATGVARRLGLSPRSVGYAGMKDKASTSRQGFTVTGADTEAAARAFEAEGAAVLEATRHRNKLRLGHLGGNRFRTFLGGADPDRARAVLVGLAATGVPNYYGPQRFGAKGDNAARGLEVLSGRFRGNRWQRDLFVSALQSFLFNEVLARRLEDGLWGRALEGDVLRKAGSGGLFLCEAPETDTARVATREVSPTGPLPGRKMKTPMGEVARREAEVLETLGLETDGFRSQTGSRRALRAPVTETGVESAPGGVWVTFECPPGVFATSVLREVVGGDVTPGGGGLG